MGILFEACLPLSPYLLKELFAFQSPNSWFCLEKCWNVQNHRKCRNSKGDKGFLWSYGDHSTLFHSFVPIESFQRTVSVFWTRNAIIPLECLICRCHTGFVNDRLKEVQMRRCDISFLSHEIFKMVPWRILHISLLANTANTLMLL